MADAFYEILDQSSGDTESGCRARSTLHTAGPWDRGLQHGGPPAALMARAVESLGAIPERALLIRCAVDIFTPVPVADVVVVARLIRTGRKVAFAEAQLALADRPDRPLMRLGAWLMRQLPAPMELPPTPTDPAPPPPGTERLPRSRWTGSSLGYLDAISWRWPEGFTERLGPSTVWTRQKIDLVAGEPVSGMQRVLVIADSGSGVSMVADPKDLLFINTDLTVHLHRPPVGDLIWMDCRSTLDPAGVGLARTILGDEAGAIGVAAQCLFVDHH